MLALRLPRSGIRLADAAAVVVVGCVSSAFALLLLSRRKMGLTYALSGSVVMVEIVAAVHHVNTAAMRLPVECRFNFRNTFRVLCSCYSLLPRCGWPFTFATIPG